MSARTKKILNFAFIFGTLAVVLIVGLNGQELSGAMDALKQMAFRWLLVCFLSYVGFVILDALSLHYFLRRQSHPISLGYAIYVSVVGWYYSNITPGASGGQPMQVYYLKKRDVPIGIGSSALTVKLFCFQFMLMVVGTIMWITNREYVAANLGSNMWILVLGYVYNAISVTFLLMMALNKRLVRFFIRLFIRIGTALHLTKSPEDSMTKWEDILNTFHASVMMLTRNPLDLFIQILLGTGQLMIQMVVTYFIYRGFLLEGATFGQIITLALMLYISASYTPLPGASGAQEGGFALYYGMVFPDGIRFMALLLWRFFTYYMSLIIGGIATVVGVAAPGERKRKPHRNPLKLVEKHTNPTRNAEVVGHGESVAEDGQACPGGIVEQAD